MTTLVLSDLHLGGRSGVDLARHPEVRERLLRALDGVERVVLLGDVVELRDAPIAEPLRVLQPFLGALGEALGGGEIVVVPGNHDHHLIAPWLERRRRERPEEPLGVAERAPASASEVGGLLAGWAGPAELSFAYPGLWLSPTVYATHGHYLDRHITIPSFERLAARGVERALQRDLRQPLPEPQGPDDYERALGPVLALLHALAQATPPSASTGLTDASARAWNLLVGDGSRRRPSAAQVGALAAYPLVIGALNRLGLGPLRASLSPRELRQAGLRAMDAVVANLGVVAEHVVFGHTHRFGPLPDDAQDEWRAPTGARLVNTGCWVHEPLFVGGGADAARSPYFPGAVLAVDPQGPPRPRRLLGDLAGRLGELRASRA